MLVIIFLILILVYRFRYVLLYAMFHKFSGEHEKPTSDSKHDPKIEHQMNYWFRMVRGMEQTWANDLKTNQPVLPVPEIEASKLNPQLFLDLTANKTQPIVIRGLLNNSKAIKEWCPEFFIKNCGDTKVLTFQPKNSEAYTSFNERVESDSLTVKEAIQQMQEANQTNSKSFYINNVTQIFQNCPELVDDLELDRIRQVDNSIDSETWLKIHLFMGGHKTGTSLHCAVAGNFFFNVYGRKKWILIDPKYSYALKSTPSKSFTFVISGLDMANPKDTILENIPRYEVDLEPGDVLYNAPWWWHYVENMTDFTIACAVRDHMAYQQSWWNNPMYMTLNSYAWTRHPWILKLAEYIKGRNSLLSTSMNSDKQIVKDLSE